jgi:pyrroline-5-carboxylate reductase
MPKEHDPEKLREKINAGLTTEQALEVLERQAQHDAQPAKQEKKTSK